MTTGGGTRINPPRASTGRDLVGERERRLERRFLSPARPGRTIPAPTRVRREQFDVILRLGSDSAPAEALPQHPVRRRAAAARSIELNGAVLAKLMILEHYSAVESAPQ